MPGFFVSIVFLSYKHKTTTILFLMDYPLGYSIGTKVKTIYRTVKNFGGEKSLANLANHNNLPTFFANFPVFVT